MQFVAFDYGFSSRCSAPTPGLKDEVAAHSVFDFSLAADAAKQMTVK
jgi:hypothetical protein